MQLLTAQVTGLQSSLTQHTDGQPLKQLKDELSTLKGLLLNRHQFPASPTPVGVANRGGAKIPDWQRTQGSPNTRSSTMKTPMGNQQEEDSSPGEEEVSAGMKGNRDDVAIAGQNGMEVAGDKEGLEDKHDILPQASNQATT